jgi:hypothetical protein
VSAGECGLFGHGPPLGGLSGAEKASAAASATGGAKRGVTGATTYARAAAREYREYFDARQKAGRVELVASRTAQTERQRAWSVRGPCVGPVGSVWGPRGGPC